MRIQSLMTRPCLVAAVLGTAVAGLAIAQSPANSATSPASPAASPAGAPARHRHSRAQGLAPARQERLDRLTAALGLSDVQKGQIKELMILRHNERGREDLPDRHSGPDQRHRDQKHHRHSHDRGAPAISRREFRRELKAVLTSEQFSKFKALRASLRQAPIAPGAAPSPAPAAH
jgi:hypothetical protein